MSGSAKPSRIRAALVDDDEVLRTELQHTLRALPDVEVVGAVSTLSEALELAALKPDVFFVDLALPDGSGFDLIKHLRAHAPACKTLVVSVFGDVERVVRAIEWGADGYLLKGAHLDQTAWALEVVFEGGAPLSPAVAGHLLRRVRQAAPSHPRHPELVLSPRELATLEGLAKGLSFKELATALGISRYTVGDHVKAIYRKLQVSSRGEAVFEAAQHGLIRLHS